MGYFKVNVEKLGSFPFFSSISYWSSFCLLLGQSAPGWVEGLVIKGYSKVESKIRGNGALNAEHPHSPSPWVCNTPALLLLRLPKRSQTRRFWFKPGHLSDLWTLNSREEVQHNHAAVSVVPKVKQSFLSWLCSELCQQRNLGLNFGAWIPPS